MVASVEYHSECGLGFYELLALHGITEDDDMPQQVKASPKGAWCKPAVGRAVTCCGKQLGAYATRDESYLGYICTDGCFSPYELSVLAPAARVAQAERERLEMEREQAEFERQFADARQERQEHRERRDSERILRIVEDDK